MQSHQGLAHGDQVVGLVAKQPQGADIGDDLLGLGFGIALRAGETRKQLRRNSVDALVPALGGEAYGYQQLQGGFKVEGALGVGEGLLEGGGNFLGALA